MNIIDKGTCKIISSSIDIEDNEALEKRVDSYLAQGYEIKHFSETLLGIVDHNAKIHRTIIMHRPNTSLRPE